MSYSPGQLPEFEVWRERRRELLREAEERRLARAARKVRGWEKPAVYLRGLAAMVRRFAVRRDPPVVAGDRRCEE